MISYICKQSQRTTLKLNIMKSRQDFVASANIETLNRCVIVSLIKDKRDSKDSTASRKLYNAKDDINRHINDYRKQIYALTDTLPYKVTVQIQDFPVDQNLIPIVLQTFNDIRIFVNFYEYPSNTLYNQAQDAPLSHFVEITPHSHNGQNKLNTKGSSMASIEMTSVSESVFNTIEDIMMDIMMYNTFTGFPDTTNLETRRKFSQVKVEYIKNNFCEYKGLWSEANAGYIALASFFRTGKKINCEDYVKCWLSLTESFNGGTPPPIKEQVKKHRLYHQLPIKEIEEYFESLPNLSGAFVLARISKRPKSLDACKRLDSVFKGSKMKIGKYIICPIAKINRFIPVAEYLDLIYIRK